MKGDTTSIIIPTKNEEKNIKELILKIIDIGIPTQYEIVVVDDSSDRTAEVAREVLARVVKGQGKGLGQAIIDGINTAIGDFIVVMDADLSHNPRAIPKLIDCIAHDGYDMAIGSRYVKNGGSEGWEFIRRVISRGACLLALPITSIKDATSGFFAFRKSLVSGIKLEPSSWKIMLEILLKAKPTRVIEVPIMFKVRKEGKSKFDKKQMVAYLKHLLLLALHKYQKLLKFGVAEGAGTVIIFILVFLLTELMGIWYMFSLGLATIIGFLFKYVANTVWTFKVVEDPDSADYEWRSFFRGSLIQKWWKQSIAKTVWGYVPNASLLLDIGCGSSPIITRYPGAVATDVNVKKLEFMQEKFPRAIYNKVPAEKLPYVEDSFDHVLCIEVLEHLPNPEKAISEIVRVLKLNGQAVIATPDYSKRLWHIAERFTPYKEKHIVQFTKEKLEEVCISYGLKPVAHKYIAGCDLVELFEKV